jgi:hypothetical protein
MRTAIINNILYPPRFIVSFFSTRSGLRLLNCSAHKYPRAIIVILDTNEGGIRTSTYSLATSYVPKNALVYQHFFRWECKTDKRGHLQRFIQGSGIHTQEGFKLNDKRNLLKAYMLKHSLLQYDITRFKDITTRIWNNMTWHDTSSYLAWRRAVKPTTLNISKTTRSDRHPSHPCCWQPSCPLKHHCT